MTVPIRPNRSSSRLLPGSIRTRFVLLLVVTLVPMLALLSWIHTQRYQTRKAQELQANLEVARAVALSFQRFLDDVSRQEMVLGGALMALGTFSNEVANRLLAESAEQYPAVETFHWVSPEGRVLASSSPGMVGEDMTQSPYFSMVSAGETLVGDLRPGQKTGEWWFTIRRGIAGPNGQLGGIVSARIAPERLGETGLGMNRPQKGGVSLVDRNGRLVYRQAAPAPYHLGEDWGARYPDLLRALKGHEATSVMLDATMQGQRRLGAWAPVPSIGWVAGAGRPEDVVMSRIRRDLQRDTLLFVLVDVMALFAAVVISRRITGPIRRLEADARRLGAGDLGHRASAGGPSEILHLVDSFNAMAGRLQAQTEALQESEALYRSIANYLPGAAVFVISPDMRYRVADGGLLEVLGYERDALEGRTIYEVEDPDSAAAMAERCRRALAGETVAYETDIHGLWVWSRFAPLRDDSGRVVATVALTLDITARKRAEEEAERRAAELLEAQRRTESILASVADSRILFDHDWRYVDINKAAEVAIGKPREELVGHTVWELFPEVIGTDFEMQARRVMDERVALSFEYLHPGPNAWWELRLFPASEGGVAVFATEITARKRSGERTRALQEITAAMSAALTVEHVVDVVLGEGVSAMGAKVTAIGLLAEGAPEMQMRSSSGRREAVPARWRPLPLDSPAALTEAAREGRTILIPSAAEYEAAYPDGVAEFRAQGLVVVVATPLRVGDRVLGSISFAGTREFSSADVAFLETIAGQTAQALERTRLYEEAERRAGELLEADRRKSEFMAVLSHELRNPLAPIRLALYILECAAPGGDQARQAIAIIDRQTSQLTHLINDLLDVTRI